MGRCLLFFFITFILLTRLLSADNSLASELSVTSIPSDVAVCYKKGKHEKYFGQTPISLKIDFNNLNRSKKFIFSKLGYKPQQQQITVDSKKVFIQLKKQDLFFNPKDHQDASLKHLQKKVNNKLEKLIYSFNDKFSKIRYQFFGKLKLTNINGITELQINILFNDSNILKELKKAGRTRNKEKKLLITMDIFNKNGTFDLIDSIASTLSTLKIDRISCVLYYTKSKTILDFDQITTYSQVYTGSTTSVSYSGNYKTTTTTAHYRTLATTKDKTIVKDKEVLTYYSLTIPTSIYNKKQKSTYKLLNKVIILTNDSRKNKIIQVKYPLFFTTL